MAGDPTQTRQIGFQSLISSGFRGSQGDLSCLIGWRGLRDWETPGAHTIQGLGTGRHAIQRPGIRSPTRSKDGEPPGRHAIEYVVQCPIHWPSECALPLSGLHTHYQIDWHHLVGKP